MNHREIGSFERGEDTSFETIGEQENGHDCPKDDCDGTLQYQLDYNWMCLKCENSWTGHDPEDGSGDLILMNEECEEVGRV